MLTLMFFKSLANRVSRGLPVYLGHSDLDGPIVSKKLPLRQNGLQLNPIRWGLFEVLSHVGGPCPWYLSYGALKIPKLKFPKQIRS